MEAFYTFNERFAKIRSKRIKKAVKGITGKKSLDLMDESLQDGQRSKKKRRVNQDVAVGDESEKASRGQEYAESGNEANITERFNEKKSVNTRAREEPLHAGSNRQGLLEEESFKIQSKGVSVRGRGRGGRGDYSFKKGKRKSDSSSKYLGSDSEDESSSENDEDFQVGFGEPHQVRRVSLVLHFSSFLF